MSHRWLVHLQVDVVAAGQLDLLAYLLVVPHFGLNLPHLIVRIARIAYLIRYIGISPQKRRGHLVEGYAPGFFIIELPIVISSAKETQIIRGIARQFHRLAQCLDRLAYLLQPFPPLL